MTFAIDPGPLDRALDHACARLEESGFVDALWARRTDVWTTDAAVQRKIADRLGWLNAIETMRPQTARLRAFGESVRREGFSDVVLLGMGGSSLAAETLRTVLDSAPGYPRFCVLDSVDPDAVRAAMDRAQTSLFLVASKSGSTIEVAALAAEAERRVRTAGIASPGLHFVAITDERTALHQRASEGAYRDVFLNPADVGGRFSALTLFGLVPAALMGIDVDALLASAQPMVEACRTRDPRRNPGLALGAVLAAAAGGGRDKLTLSLPDALAPLGPWIEQLVAESTGKDGKGIVPVLGDPAEVAQGEDRIVVEIEAGGPAAPGSRARRGPPHVRLMYEGLGAEFFRWEIATATAGFLLGVNPFDEPNVQQAKDATRALLDAYASERQLPLPEAHVTIGDGRITLSAAARSAGATLTPSVRDLLRAGDYVALLAYLPPDDPRFTPQLQRLRSAVAGATGCAATLGFGPRYLHSTGQLHKGGPNRGVLVVVTADSAEDFPVPGQRYSFGTLELAQALGDFQALDRLGRRALLVRLSQRDPALLQQITETLA
ncbi:MAG: glucose-6-phosphate isomerase [Acidobacteria bacterium]|nr:glucose-6-phosphate isomerase [Acidobacteriota bacterium]